MAVQADEKTMPAVAPPVRRSVSPDQTVTVRMGYSKGPEVRFTSHLDVMRILVQSARRADIRFAMTQGHHARPKISAGPPLPLGYTSGAEYIDLTAVGGDPESLRQKLNSSLPEGFECFASAALPARGPSLSASISLTDYRIRFEESVDQNKLAEAVRLFEAGTAIPCRIKDRESNLAEWVRGIGLRDGIELRLRIGSNGSIRVEEVVRALLDLSSAPDMRIHRTGLFIEKNQDILTPLEDIQRA
jgi:radical SAM-linked protein